MIGLLPIDENEKLALLVSLDSLEDMIIDVHGNEMENKVYIKFKNLIEPLKQKINNIDFKF